MRNKLFLIFKHGAEFIAALWLILPSLNCVAGEIWFYDYREPPNTFKSRSNAQSSGERHWIWTEFNEDPYPGQLRAVAKAHDYDRASLLFKHAPLPGLTEEYAELAQTWASRGVRGQLKFIGVLPNEGEAGILKPACDAGLKITFISAQIPSAYEVSNLLKLKECVDVLFVLNRYPKYNEISVFQSLAPVKFGFAVPFYPSYAQMDVLNIINLPTSLEFTDGFPSLEDLDYLNHVKHLETEYIDFAIVPTSDQYSVLTHLDRQGRRLCLNWGFSTASHEDVAAWLKLFPNRLQIGKGIFESAEHKQDFERFGGEIIVVTSPLLKVDVMERLALKPSEL